MSKTQVQIPQQPFTVLAIRPDSAQILCIQVEAIDGFHAFTVASEHEQTKGDVEMVVALTGHQQEGQLLIPKQYENNLKSLMAVVLPTALACYPLHNKVSCSIYSQNKNTYNTR